MLAMDVVDTLRRNDRLVVRELNQDNQDDALLEQLRDIYSAQGIEVPEHILREGVEALREDRFKYTPTPPSFSRSLAKLYVSRDQWGRKALMLFGVIALCIFGYYALVIWPNAREERRIEQQFTQDLPAAFEQLHSRITALTNNNTILSDAEQLRHDGLSAIQQRDIERAQYARSSMENIANALQQEYSLRIVSGPGSTSGVWRIPDDNPNARNYYIIVEPITASGQVIALDILNEENNKSISTKRFGIRVPKNTFETVGQDKSDDGIIQNNIIGKKARGIMEIEYSLPVLGGMITDW